MSRNVDQRIDALAEARDLEGLLSLASTLTLEERYPPAERALRAADRLGEPTAADSLGNVLESQGRLDEAEAAYERSIRNGLDQSRVRLADMRLYEKHRHAELEELLRPAVASRTVTANFVLGKLLAQQAGREEEATAAFLAESDPRVRPLALTELGRMWMGRPGREAKAEESLRASGNPAAEMLLVELLLVLDRPEEAVEPLRRAAAAGVSSAWNNLTLLHRQLGHDAAADDAYREAIETGARDLIAGYGEFLLSAGRTTEAESVLRDGVDDDPRCALLLAHIVRHDPGRADEALDLLRSAAGRGVALAAIALARWPG